MRCKLLGLTHADYYTVSSRKYLQIRIYNSLPLVATLI